MKVKICGVTRAEDARRACELGAWAIGLIFARSPRRVTLEQAQAARAGIAPGVLAVGVFQGAPRGEIKKAIEALALDAIQLHGLETPEDCAGYKIPVWKSLPGEPGSAKVAAIYSVAGLLIEPVRRDASDAERREAWKAAAACRGAAPLILLAGGLTPENASEAARVSKADVLDVSSGVESAPGVKDAAKLERLFAALKGA